MENNEKYIRVGTTLYKIVHRPLISEFYKDACSFNISKELENINSPTLFINSGADEIGDPKLSDNARSIIGNKIITEKYEIEGANHSFNCQPEQEQEAINKTIEWLKSL